MIECKAILCGVCITLIGISSVFANTQCGPYRLAAGSDGFMHINGAKPESPKMTFLKAKEDYDNIKMD